MWIPACYKFHKAPLSSSSQAKDAQGAQSYCPSCSHHYQRPVKRVVNAELNSHVNACVLGNMIRKTDRMACISAIIFTSELLQCIVCIREILQGVPLL